MHCLMFSKRFYVQLNPFVWYFPCILRCKCSPFLVYTTSTFLKVHSSFSLIYSFKDCPYHLFMIIRGEKTVDGFLYREKDHSGMKSIMFKKKKGMKSINRLTRQWFVWWLHKTYLKQYPTWCILFIHACRIKRVPEREIFTCMACEVVVLH
jgi:hypothetical protein